ncbi:MAG: DUF1858 domain-containing protein [Bacteroidetes bacterium]|nr:DUF1858 domain-containing protein [Bacteroidota bacterium]
MKITAQTKISELIKQNPAALEAIVSINKHFEKLRNPILRKIMASRVSIADAAKIGGCKVEAFYEKLAPLGFETVNQVESQKAEPVITYKLDISSIPPERIKELDVRAGIASGADPFLTIMKEIDLLKSGDVLIVINSFEPVPLIRILEKKGYDFRTEKPVPNEYHT